MSESKWTDAQMNEHLKKSNVLLATYVHHLIEAIAYATDDVVFRDQNVQHILSEMVNHGLPENGTTAFLNEIQFIEASLQSMNPLQKDVMLTLSKYLPYINASAILYYGPWLWSHFFGNTSMTKQEKYVFETAVKNFNDHITIFENQKHQKMQNLENAPMEMKRVEDVLYDANQRLVELRQNKEKLIKSSMFDSVYTLEINPNITAINEEMKVINGNIITYKKKLQQLDELMHPNPTFITFQNTARIQEQQVIDSQKTTLMNFLRNYRGSDLQLQNNSIFQSFEPFHPETHAVLNANITFDVYGNLKTWLCLLSAGFVICGAFYMLFVFRKYTYKQAAKTKMIDLSTSLTNLEIDRNSRARKIPQFNSDEYHKNLELSPIIPSDFTYSSRVPHVSFRFRLQNLGNSILKGLKNSKTHSMNQPLLIPTSEDNDVKDMRAVSAMQEEDIIAKEHLLITWGKCNKLQMDEIINLITKDLITFPMNKFSYYKLILESNTILQSRGISTSKLINTLFQNEIKSLSKFKNVKDYYDSLKQNIKFKESAIEFWDFDTFSELTLFTENIHERQNAANRSAELKYFMEERKTEFSSRQIEMLQIFASGLDESRSLVYKCLETDINGIEPVWYYQRIINDRLSPLLPFVIPEMIDTLKIDDTIQFQIAFSKIVQTEINRAQKILLPHENYLILTYLRTLCPTLYKAEECRKILDVILSKHEDMKYLKMEIATLMLECCNMHKNNQLKLATFIAGSCVPQSESDRSTFLPNPVHGLPTIPHSPVFTPPISTIPEAPLFKNTRNKKLTAKDQQALAALPPAAGVRKRTNVFQEEQQNSKQIKASKQGIKRNYT